MSVYKAASGQTWRCAYILTQDRESSYTSDGDRGQSIGGKVEIPRCEGAVAYGSVSDDEFLCCRGGSTLLCLPDGPTVGSHQSFLYKHTDTASAMGSQFRSGNESRKLACFSRIAAIRSIWRSVHRCQTASELHLLYGDSSHVDHVQGRICMKMWMTYEPSPEPSTFAIKGRGRKVIHMLFDYTRRLKSSQTCPGG